jgi:hypothetical protein
LTSEEDYFRILLASEALHIAQGCLLALSHYFELDAILHYTISIAMMRLR